MGGKGRGLDESGVDFGSSVIISVIRPWCIHNQQNNTIVIPRQNELVQVYSINKQLIYSCILIIADLYMI